jgi:hypothetical protein
MRPPLRRLRPRGPNSLNGPAALDRHGEPPERQ